MLCSQFQVIPEEDKFKYSLPTDLAKDATTNLETYIKQANLKQQILIEDPVPDNLNQVKKLDDFVCHILNDKHKQKIWTWMSHLKKFNQRMPVRCALCQSCVC